jgi:hypothetical protein
MIFSDFYETLKGQIDFRRAMEVIAQTKGKSEYKKFLERSIIEKHEDTYSVEKVELAPDRTVRTYVTGHKYPLRSYPIAQSMVLTATYKRLLPLAISGGIFGRITAILFIWLNRKAIAEWFDYVFDLNNVLLVEESWSQPIKEIRKALKDELEKGFIDAVSLVLEYDSAWRFIFQDIMAEFRPEEFGKNWRKELRNIFDIAINRGNANDKVKFNNIYKIMILALTLNRKLLKQVKRIVAKLNIEEMKPTEEDRYWMLFLKTYSCFGLSPEQRDIEFNKMKSAEI